MYAKKSALRWCNI